MASEGDCELTSAVTGSLSGDKTTGEGGSIQHTASSGLPQKIQPQTSVSENEKVGSSGDSSPDTGPIREEDVGSPCDSSPDTGPIREEDVELSGDPSQDTGSEDRDEVGSSGVSSPDTGPIREEEKTQTLSIHQPRNVLHSEPESTINVDKGIVSKPEKTGGEVGSSGVSSPDTGPIREEEKTQTLSIHQPRNVLHSEPESTINVDKGIVSKPEKTGGEVGSSGVSSPDSGPIREQEVGSSGVSSQDTGSEDRDEVGSPGDPSPDTGPIREEEKTQTLSIHQPRNVLHSEPESTINVDKGIVSKPEKTGGEVGSSGVSSPDSGPIREQEVGSSGVSSQDTGSEDRDEVGSPGDPSPDTGPIREEEKTQTLSIHQPRNVLHSEPESTINVDKGIVSKPEKTGGEVGSSGVSSPDSGPKREQEVGSSGVSSQDTGSEDRDEVGSSGVSSPDTGPIREEDVELSGDPSQDTGSEDRDEPLQHIAPSGLPQERQPQIRVGGIEKQLMFGAAVAFLLAAMVWLILNFSDSTLPVQNEVNVVDVFNQEMEKLKTSFPNQRPELWRRSLIHLRRHLKTEHPTEPVSLILTSGHRAERTLGCLARCLAQAFSTARNSSVLNINGTSKASQDSDQVKLDIDSELRKAFEGKTFAAVIHRFEELPPGSTLIFYRYCDHENAAYKNVFLAFTVMLDAEVEVPSNVGLGRVEEMVQEHVKQKFVSSDKLATFNEMDVDKLSGLWSRISHLILPVAAEETIEQQGCGKCDQSF
ncbi:torsin-1A-interacting protein 2 isoform X33 [Ctenopharyngodon idella]|uniref:torsin-1A-interacting protein 2 isoform X30 n=1 Tax=Ctenopharyngodon idella TaxID=7959 RepID=UPI00222E2F0E|nr:torsin-1A-interacting protein 2 isoform X30 [Ctenopharyngodon idella]XP_051759334.1 torsin-1A-interacting protein 2 isoform X31 [Ctenopharyngodon idella]XP_051759335.1 torsin-1A-interacting protein 2 isoform X32 [Ctenopharyngodon idella]XP_051759336.1 torsin-1A-interacting protein 2 isoform X33 [Ctenopharyngodon idella]